MHATRSASAPASAARTVRRVLATALASVVAGLAVAAPVGAQLANKDFLTAGDNLLVTDAATGFEWLTPVHTRNLVYDAPEVQSIKSGYGFRYATANEVRSMLVTNFNPPIGEPGTYAGFDAADAFFALFGIADQVRCKSGEVACPRTQGFTSTAGTDPNTRLAFGMIQFEYWGWMIADNPWPTDTHDRQAGSWLVRPAAVTTAPEPGTLVLLITGLGALALARTKRRPKATI